ncbi:uncharacterized protein [Linepithema humile]|uniref:uncharacterized protein isoform X2 n=1 Tax=Linepithema humile TaxID=83485 RepID=UPI00351E1B5F
MSQLLDLISRDRGGKLALCWHAATINEKLFKNFYGSAHVQKINITEICDEILKEIKNKPPTLNLRMVSQLMYGVIKIYKYQIMKYEKDIFELRKILYPRKETDAVPIPDIIDVHLPDESYLIAELGNKKDLHLLPEEDFKLREKTFMEIINFGELTNKEMEGFDREEWIFEAMRIRDSDRRNDGKTWQDDTWHTEINDTEIAEEVHRERHMSQEIGSPFRTVSLVNAEERRERLLLTPQKRPSHHARVETPKKIRRLSLGTAIATDIVPLENVTAPELTISEAPVLPLPAEEIEVPENMELESLENEEDDHRIRRRRSKKFIIDKRMILKSDVLRKWQQNTKIYCVDIRYMIQKPNQIRSNVKDLFEQPARRWGASLKQLFDNHITGPFMRETEDFTLEAVQGPEQMIMTSFMQRSKSVLEQSSIVADKSTHNTLNIQPTTMNDIIQEAEEAPMIPLAESIPHITILEDNINIELHQHQEKTDASRETVLLNTETVTTETQCLTTEDRILESSIPSQHVQLTLDEILAIVEKKTQKTEIIKFEQLIPTKKYSKQEAANAFYLLLGKCFLVCNVFEKIIINFIDINFINGLLALQWPMRKERLFYNRRLVFALCGFANVWYTLIPTKD